MSGPSRADLRRFGLTVGGAFALLALVSRWRGHVLPPRVLALLAVLLVVPGLVAPGVLAPVRRVWLGAAALLGEVNSRVILTVFFYLVIAPIGFVLRHLVRDPLDRSLTDGKASNWIKRERQPVDPARYQQQF
ncbi:MAG TPA: SxtJ family membrane protein [Verrucomicrobiae bacterium]|nr:SxtJ family membrane protein [Verrucomicrobiae bacterium]